MSAEEDNIYTKMRIYRVDHEKLRRRGEKGVDFADILHLTLLELEQYEIMFDDKAKGIAKVEAKKRLERWQKRLKR